MTDDTEKKILEVALKIFCEKGYAGTTTRVIAIESGYTQMTIHRKFKTKDNLFNQAMVYGIQKLNENAPSMVFIDKEYKDSHEFLEFFIKNLTFYVGENLELFKLIFNQDREIIGPVLKENIFYISNYIEKYIPNQEVDYLALAITIFSFVYMHNLAIHHGPPDPTRDIILKNFIKNITLSIQ